MAAYGYVPGTPRYTKFRADGWPYCPGCGADELWSQVITAWQGAEPKPTLEDCLAGPMACYACPWRFDPALGVYQQFD